MMDASQDLAQKPKSEPTSETRPGFKPDYRDSLVFSLARQVMLLDPGERARLRRMQPEAPSPDALGLTVRLLVVGGAKDHELNDRHAARWSLFLQALAILAHGTRDASSRKGRKDAAPADGGAPPALHDSKAKVGRVFRDMLTDYGKYDPEEVDSRLLTLLEAREAGFDSLLIRMIRRAAQAGALTINILDLWRLIEARDEESIEAARLGVARDFYRSYGAQSNGAAAA